MRNNCELFVGPLAVEDWEDEIDPLTIALFVPGDKIVSPMSVDEWEERGGDRDAWNPRRGRFCYRCLCHEMRDRLNLRGWTLQTALEAFRIKVAAEQRAADDKSKLDLESSELRELYRFNAEILKSLSPEAWIEAVRFVKVKKLRRDPFLYKHHDFTPEIRYVLRSISRFGHVGSDLRGALRLTLEACDPDEEVVYDLTELAVNEFTSDEDLTLYVEYLIERETIHSRTIVLTEGSTDKVFLERSLAILYPHLAPFFSFMDFEGTKMPGGAGVLAQLVRAFAAVGIANRVLAVFDNDTAGKVAVEALGLISLPPNMKVLQLPRLELAACYPTMGPTGLSLMDVNGFACSIELFLGEDILRIDDGALAPIQWTGYEPKVRQYQGEIVGKREIHERFRRKLNACDQTPDLARNKDWLGINEIIRSMLNAFVEVDRDAHLDYERSVATGR